VKPSKKKSMNKGYLKSNMLFRNFPVLTNEEIILIRRSEVS